MATTLPLIEILKVDHRKNGDISFAKVTIDLDGTPYTCNFYCRVGEEPIVVEADTITVADAQIEAARKGRAHAARLLAEREARDAAALAALLADIDADLDAKDASDAARAELHAHYKAHRSVAISLDCGSDQRRFHAMTMDILRRHALI